MLNTLSIEIAEAEGALMRLIGLVERRGYTIATLDKSEAQGGQSTVTLKVKPRDAARQLDVLIRQIGRLMDVRAVFTPEIAAMKAAHTSHAWRQACPPRN